MSSLTATHPSQCQISRVKLRRRVTPAVRCLACERSDSNAQLDCSKRAALLGLASLASASLLAPRAACAKRAGGDAGDWSSPGLAVPIDEDAPKFYSTPGGVKYQNIVPGAAGGRSAGPNSRVLLDYVLRRANGYFIYSTVEGVSFQPKDLPVGPVALQLGSGQVLPGLEEALDGMTEGGKRRILVPPALGYNDLELLPQPPGFAARRQVINHRGEPLLFEVQLLRVIS